MTRTSVIGPELPHLETFHVVCEEGGFTAAAHRLGCTQPAVSYQVRALERAVRARLVERGGRRLLLTPAGERLKTFCRDFFAELARVRSECAGDHRLDPLRLGSASGFGRYVLMPTLCALREAKHEAALELHVRFDAADVVLELLERGECEAAFVYTRRISNRLRYRAVYDEELVLIAPRALARAARSAADADGLQPLPFVTYQEGDYVFGRWFEANYGEQPASVNSVAHFSELEEVIDFVRRGVGMSIVPRDAVAAAAARKEVDIVYCGRGEPCLNQVYMVVRAGSLPRPELRELTRLLRNGSGD